MSDDDEARLWLRTEMAFTVEFRGRPGGEMTSVRRLEDWAGLDFANAIVEREDGTPGDAAGLAERLRALATSAPWPRRWGNPCGDQNRCVEKCRDRHFEPCGGWAVPLRADLAALPLYRLGHTYPFSLGFTEAGDEIVGVFRYDDAVGHDLERARLERRTPTHWANVHDPDERAAVLEAIEVVDWGVTAIAGGYVAGPCGSDRCVGACSDACSCGGIGLPILDPDERARLQSEPWPVAGPDRLTCVPDAHPPLPERRQQG